MINYTTGKPIINIKPDELESLGITIPVITSDGILNQKIEAEYQQALKNNFDKLSKYTLYDALVQLFDSTEMPNNSDFALYADILKNMRIAKERDTNNIDISKEELEKLKKIFSKPPKIPQLNKLYAFVLECVEQSYIDIIKPEIGVKK